MFARLTLGASALVITLAGGALLPPALGAQTRTAYHAHLSLVPVDAGGARRTSGVGEATATLEGGILQIAGTFEGLASSVSRADLHQGGPGFRGPALHTLVVSGSTEGRIEGRIELTEEQVQALALGHLYIQVYAETNPDGAIRGWFFPGEDEN